MFEENNPPVRLLACYQQVLSTEDEPDMVVSAPGRAIWAAARFTGTTFFTLIDGDNNRRTRFDVRSARKKETLLRRPLPRWARYAAGVTALIEARSLPGADILYCSDEPNGPRGEHAVGILIAALWHELNDLSMDEDDLLQIAEMVRREYVGG